MDIRYDYFVELLEHLAHASEKDLPPMSVASVIKKARGTGNPRLHYDRGHVTVTFQTQYGPLQIGEAWVAYLNRSALMTTDSVLQGRLESNTDWREPGPQQH